MIVFFTCYRHLQDVGYVTLGKSFLPGYLRHRRIPNSVNHVSLAGVSRHSPALSTERGVSVQLGVTQYINATQKFRAAQLLVLHSNQ
jgi:hypothetical protein